MKKIILLAVAVAITAAAGAQSLSQRGSTPTMKTCITSPKPAVVTSSPVVLGQPVEYGGSIAGVNAKENAGASALFEFAKMSNIELTDITPRTDITLKSRSMVKSTSDDLWDVYAGYGTDYETASDVSWYMYPATGTYDDGSTVELLADVTPNCLSSSLDYIYSIYTISDNELTIEPQYFATADSGTYYLFIFNGSADDGVIRMTIGDDGSLTVSDDTCIYIGLFTSSEWSIDTYVFAYQATYNIEYDDPSNLRAPTAAFDPTGLYLNVWHSDVGYYYYYNMGMIPAYSPVSFKNYTSGTVTGYSWYAYQLGYSSDEGYYADTEFTGTDEDFTFETEAGQYGPTQLAAINESVYDTYVYGWGNYKYTSYSLMAYAGMDSEDFNMGESAGSTPVVGKANLDYGGIVYTNFGTGDLFSYDTYGAVEEVALYQGIPEAPLYIEGVTLLLKDFTDNGMELTCRLVKASRSSDGSINLGDVIAESETLSYVTNSYTTVTFTDFYVYDEDGLTQSVDYLFIEDEFAVVFDGWNNGTFSAYMISEYCYDGSTMPSYYFTLENYDGFKWLTGFYGHIVQGFICTYGILHTEDSTDLVFDGEGGSQTINIFPLFCGSDSDGNPTTAIALEGDSEIPDWVEVEIGSEDYTDSWEFDLVVTAEELPSDVDERSGSFRLYQKGAYLDITVTQSASGGISSTLVDEAKPVVTLDGDNIVVCGDATDAELYNMAGQKVAQGEGTIDASALSTGVYIVKLSDGTAVKVIK